MDDILKPAADLANSVLNSLTKRFGSVIDSAQPKQIILDEKEQLDLFLSMSEGELEEIKEKVGLTEFNKYVNRMMEIAGANNEEYT